jgi:Xaa-Pro aminopeptidase
VARTAVIGGPSPEQKSIYERLYQVHLATIEMARPGNRACDLFNRAKEEYARQDIPFTLPHAGHGLGLLVHEKPLLTGLDDTVFEPDTVICIETRVRWIGKEGYHIEDLLHITEDGPQVLTNYFATDELFVI